MRRFPIAAATDNANIKGFVIIESGSGFFVSIPSGIPELPEAASLVLVSESDPIKRSSFGRKLDDEELSLLLPPEVPDRESN